jgi:small-conductance mechanosensitive channel
MLCLYAAVYTMPFLLDQVFFGNTVFRWLIAALLVLGVWFAISAVRLLVMRYFRRIARSSSWLDSELIVAITSATNSWLIFTVALTLGLLVLDVPPSLRSWIITFAVLALLIQVGIWGSVFIGRLVQRYTDRNLEENAERVVNVNALSFVARLVLYSLLVLLALDNIPGVEVTALVASLGIGGIAVALALQNILSDLFASLSITFDKPFILGDFIIVDDLMGTVEHIGLKTTRVRSLSGEQLIFANNDLLSSRVRNLRRMEERRVVFHLRVLLQTSPAQLRQIPTIIREVIERQEQVRFDRAHFARFDPDALAFEIVYFVLSADFNLYMDIQQAINLEIVERFAAAEIHFAYPTQSVYLPEFRSQESAVRMGDERRP